MPWSLLKAENDPPQAGDEFAASWTVHWSDEDGRICRGHLVEFTNPDKRPYRFQDASSGAGQFLMARWTFLRRRPNKVGGAIAGGNQGAG